ncbi:Protein tyrosine kinase/Protein kinase domain containing protein, putative [Angomonas deanei]|uniref:Protein tyrosine kinase/Protein kinase domain containing protein, putative n=1 Tax=Angomonas deanei TaxID=59799 RepID=A0A7G2C1Y9_9TRYP|nr:Protein tyrosine kinase/Protein kinase domain containing protein, putative [Angomonas deanei]
MYIDHTDYPTKNEVGADYCNGVPVVKSFTYYFCADTMDLIQVIVNSGTLDDRDIPTTNTSSYICRHIIGLTTAAQYFGQSNSMKLTPESEAYILALHIVDNAEKACEPPPIIMDAYIKYVEHCNVVNYDMYYYRINESLAINQCAKEFSIDGKNILTTQGFGTDTHMQVVTIDRTPRSVFLGSIERTKTVSVVLSVVILFLTLLISVMMWYFIVFPIRWISQGMKKAAVLSGDTEEMRRKKSYTIISEVNQLYDSYVELRKALRELKAYVPQGLFITPHVPSAQKSSVLAALLGINVTGTDADEEEDEEEIELPRKMRVKPDLSDKAVLLSPLVSQQGRAVMEEEEEMKAFSASVSDNNNFKKYNPSMMSPLGRGGTSREGAGSGSGTKKGMKGVEFSLPQEDDCVVHVVAVPNLESPTSKRQPEGREERSSSDRSTSPSSAAGRRKAGSTFNHTTSTSDNNDSLYLNLKPQLNVNKFRNVTCSFLFFSFTFRYIDVESLELEVSSLMGIVVKAVLQWGGVLEVFRPDIVAITFGAHSSMAQHVQVGTACALTILRKLPKYQRAYTRAVMDSGSFFVGNCGAHSRISRIVFGDHFDFLMDLSKHDLALGRLLVTDRVAPLLPQELAVPVDFVIPQRDMGYGVQLFQVIDPLWQRNPRFVDGVQQFRELYNLAMQGHYKDVLAKLETGNFYDTDLAAQFHSAVLHLMQANPPRPRYCRFQLPAFEPLGSSTRLQSTKYQYDKLSAAEFAQASGAANQSALSISFGFGFEEESSNDDNGVSKAAAFYSHTGGISLAGSNGVSPLSAKDAGSLRQDSIKEPRSNARRLSTEGIPSSITDHTGETWRRMPLPIGAGSFAEVYVVINTTGVMCAMKCMVLNSNHINLDNVVQEVNIACKLFQDSIVNYTGWVHQAPYLFLFMEYMPGGTISNTLRAFPTGMPLSIAKRYARDMLRGLAYLHKNNVIHADFKPQNVLLTVDGCCRISDFGSSVTRASSVSVASDVFSLRGTPLYMAPEVACGETPTVASDMWSFGITLFEMLTGKLPWVMKLEANEPAGEGSKGEVPEEPTWGPVEGLSDVRFLQLYAQKNIKVMLNPSDLPSTESFSLLSLCLIEEPTERATALDLLNHAFLISL